MKVTEPVITDPPTRRPCANTWCGPISNRTNIFLNRSSSTGWKGVGLNPPQGHVPAEACRTSFTLWWIAFQKVTLVTVFWVGPEIMEHRLRFHSRKYKVFFKRCNFYKRPSRGRFEVASRKQEKDRKQNRKTEKGAEKTRKRAILLVHSPLHD